MEHTEGKIENVIWGDARTEEFVYFMYGTTFHEDLEQPDHMIIKKALLDPKYRGYWDDLYLHEDLPLAYMKQKMRVYYETDEYVGLCLDKFDVQ